MKNTMGFFLLLLMASGFVSCNQDELDIDRQEEYKDSDLPARNIDLDN